MNNQLYIDLKKEIEEGISNFELYAQRIEVSEFVRNLLMNKLSEYGERKDRIAIICAFYNTTKHESFSFLKDFYINMFHSFFSTPDLFKQTFEDIVENIILQNFLFEIGNDSLIKSVYERSKYMSENDEHPKYQVFYREINRFCVEKGLIDVTSINDSNNISSRIEEHKKLDSHHNESDKIKNAVLFKDAASTLGLENSNDLLKKTEKEGINPLNIDKIVISNEVIEMLTSESSKVSTVSNNLFSKMIVRMKQRNMLKNVALCVEKEEELEKLNIVKRDDEFDKIASCGKEVLVTIRASVRKVKDNTIIFVVVNIETIKQALRNVKDKISKTEIVPIDFTVEDYKTAIERAAEKDANSMFPYRPEEKIMSGFENSKNLDGVVNSDIISTKKM